MSWLILMGIAVLFLVNRSVFIGGVLLIISIKQMIRANQKREEEKEEERLEEERVSLDREKQISVNNKKRYDLVDYKATPKMKAGNIPDHVIINATLSSDDSLSEDKTQDTAPEKAVAQKSSVVKTATSKEEDYLNQFRNSNAAISNEEISAYISRMEVASNEIFRYIKERPESAQQVTKFMDYYLPTTMKLLDTYSRFDRQSVKGDTINETMSEIERMLGVVTLAFENELDSLFKEEAMDVVADIHVFETMLKQEGLAEDDMMLKIE